MLDDDKISINPAELVTTVAIVGGALTIGCLIVDDVRLLLFSLMGMFWLLLLPSHARIAVHLSLLTFGTAFIIPFLPGRPFLWEFASVLAWSGIVIGLAMRQHHHLLTRTLQLHRLMFSALAGYCIVLIITMFERGAGFRVLGNAQVGGRFYFQQISCSIFPLLFASCRWKEQAFPKYLMLQCLLTASYIISDIIFSFGSYKSYMALQFLEIPNDALSFELASNQSGIRRFQSFGIVAQGCFFALLLRHNLVDWFSFRRFHLPMLVVLILGFGTLSGHRWVLVITAMTLICSMWFQNFFSAKSLLFLALSLTFSLIIVYSFSRNLPLPVQRSISFLPGISVDSQAYVDATSTLHTRELLRHAGWKMVPEYLWLGRGFGQSSTIDYSVQWDPTSVTWHLNQGKFYNGPIGLLVNTGLFGAICMALFLFAGTRLAMQIGKRLKAKTCPSAIDRACCLVTSLWLSQTFGFIFLHGDVEHAPKMFFLLAGLLIACERLQAKQS